VFPVLEEDSDDTAAPEEGAANEEGNDG